MQKKVRVDLAHREQQDRCPPAVILSLHIEMQRAPRIPTHIYMYILVRLRRLDKQIDGHIYPRVSISDTESLTSPSPLTDHPLEHLRLVVSNAANLCARKSEILLPCTVILWDSPDHQDTLSFVLEEERRGHKELCCLVSTDRVQAYWGRHERTQHRMYMQKYIFMVCVCPYGVHPQGRRCSQRGKDAIVQQLSVSTKHDGLIYPRRWLDLRR